jgi:SMI1-KNR4 cell-wall
MESFSKKLKNNFLYTIGKSKALSYYFAQLSYKFPEDLPVHYNSVGQVFSLVINDNMQIKYLKKLEKNKKIGGQTIRGVSEIAIQTVEKKFKIKFPRAYKEYLLLAGEYAGRLPIMDTDDLETISSDWHQEIMREEMEDTGTKIEPPFWLFAESNGCEIFLFFYLDENTDDPNVYLVNYALEDRKRDIVNLNKTFSKAISDAIDGAIRYEKEGY